MVIKAIIPAAGYGTRNLPVTKTIPKEMFPIGGRPAIDYVVQEAVQAGIEEILIILSRNKTEIMNYFDHSPELEHYLYTHHKEHWLSKIMPPRVTITYLRQSEALGLGHAVSLARQFAGNDPVAVLLPDQVSLQSRSPLRPLLALHHRHGGTVVGLQEVPLHLLQNYGVADPVSMEGRTLHLQGFVEKPKQNPPSAFAALGRYVFTPEIFAALATLERGTGNELQLTDAINRLCKESDVYGYLFREKWYDISIEKEYLSIQRQVYRKKMKKGGASAP
ncbi:UTP--glucose-1-phosphate uridylyltransferase [Paenibacillus phyllosphaerae]|uniref:UTP--glucose-1-phosphate uridylyltransferase n=1 Tax=Paenibacillus phyllosphaerae TaxID=274593 RepID=A0A7W5B3F1_9BACL|nr:UTP--glucose-1-phosphate uridylyltransferase [Paenibacillus phyllosphaerae]MBB3113689.1 UTP--glucose-1-phosphate uridylyltransferase [Paenibacillus phyllosphaerae]